MPLLKIDVNQATYEKLVTIAVHEYRSIPQQAEMLLRRAVPQAYRKVKTTQAREAREEVATQHVAGEEPSR